MNNRSLRFWILLAVLALVALKLPTGVSQWAGKWVREVMAPLQEATTGFFYRLQEAGQVIRGLGGMAQENRLLTAEVTHLRNQLRMAKRLQRENILLRESLDFTQNSLRSLIACEVIARDISGWWQTVRIDKGSAHGVRPDMAVISVDGLVGRTVSVSAHTTDVLLISDPTCRISVTVERTGASGILYGKMTNRRGQPLCRLDFVNKDAPVRIGDPVTTSGMGGVFPRGLLVGYVDQLYTGPSGLYQYADVLPATDIGHLNVLFVVEDKPVETDYFLSVGDER